MSYQLLKCPSSCIFALNLVLSLSVTTKDRPRNSSSRTSHFCPFSIKLDTPFLNWLFCPSHYCKSQLSACKRRWFGFHCIQRADKSVTATYLTLGGIVSFCHSFDVSKTHRHLLAMATHGFCQLERHQICKSSSGAIRLLLWFVCPQNKWHNLMTTFLKEAKTAHLLIYNAIWMICLTWVCHAQSNMIK